MSPHGGDERVRTDGLLLARQALSQLSYTPIARFSHIFFFRTLRFFSQGPYLENYIVLSVKLLALLTFSYLFSC